MYQIMHPSIMILIECKSFLYIKRDYLSFLYRKIHIKNLVINHYLCAYYYLEIIRKIAQVFIFDLKDKSLFIDISLFPGNCLSNTKTNNIQYFYYVISFFLLILLYITLRHIKMCYQQIGFTGYESKYLWIH